MEAYIYFLLQLSEVSFPGPFNESFWDLDNNRPTGNLHKNVKSYKAFW